MSKPLLVFSLFAVAADGFGLASSAPSACSALQAELEASLSPREDMFNLNAHRGVLLALGTAQGAHTNVNVPPPEPVAEGALTSDTVLAPVWSASKLTSVITVMKLVEAGLLDLDAPISEYIEWWTSEEGDPRSRVTLRHLLSHTSGFGTNPEVGSSCEMSDMRGGGYTQESCARQIYDRSYGHIAVGLMGVLPGVEVEDVKPGLFFSYGEHGYQITGLVAETVTGTDFNDLWREYVADPLGVGEDCAYMGENIDLGSMLACSASDYQTVLQAYASGTLLSEASVRDMETPNTLEATQPEALPGMDTQYGLGGWIINKGPVKIFHSLGMDGVMPWVKRTEHGSGADGSWGLLFREGGVAIGNPAGGLASYGALFDGGLLEWAVGLDEACA